MFGRVWAAIVHPKVQPQFPAQRPPSTGPADAVSNFTHLF